jgi:hypothetical protein
MCSFLVCLTSRESAKFLERFIVSNLIDGTCHKVQTLGDEEEVTKVGNEPK